jgi:cytoskeletal protein RodZ
MASVAEQLRTAREANNLTIAQIADITKVRGDHIRAIEEGNYDVFSAPVYIRGFVRSYARLLKLDVPQVMAALNVELGKTDKFAEPPPLSDQPRTVVDFITLQLSKIDWRKAAVVLGLVAVLGIATLIFLSLRRSSGTEPPQNIKPGVYQPASNRLGDTLQLPPSQTPLRR